MRRLADKVALVTGAGSGLGAADCEVLAAAGAHVFVTDVSLDAAKQVAARIGESAMPLQLDVSSSAAWMSVVAEVDRRFGRLDILVNNAGLCLLGDVETQTLEQFRLTQAVMNEGVFLGCQLAFPLLKKSASASIINISSIASMRGFAGFVAYAAAKGAVASMTKAIAAMCQDKAYKIRCNSVHPGEIETPMQQEFEGRLGEERLVPPGVLPKGAIGAPSDVAAMVLFLASDDSRFITGAELVVDNGATMRAT
jgi:3(or 17)beta-hydroxysteroid dehydrogenase